LGIHVKIFAQLLKEFWLPLLLGIGWTTYNVLDKPAIDWNVRNVLNIFGPTFFFMSWLVAQWYRVRKQQSVEEGLTGIHADIRAMQSPLLPCGLFYTLKYSCPDERLSRVFGSRLGWKKYTDGTAILRPVGLVKLNSAYNSIEMDALESRCSLKDEDINQLGSAINAVTLLPVSVCAEFFFGQKLNELRQASLILSTIPQTQTISKVIELELFDSTVFQDVVCKGLSVQKSSDRSWSTTDLRGSYLRVTLEFFFIRPINGISKEDWPSLHNLQLIFGPKLEHLLSFNLEQLSKQVVRNSPNPLARGDAEFIQILFECAIDENVYKNNLYATSDFVSQNG
jgi:hypothetical protein